jgi:hypothetical protein
MVSKFDATSRMPFRPHGRYQNRRGPGKSLGRLHGQVHNMKSKMPAIILIFALTHACSNESDIQDPDVHSRIVVDAGSITTSNIYRTTVRQYLPQYAALKLRQIGKVPAATMSKKI